jgi:protocatechuate 3,4-dioxygenase beta subunit
MDAPEGLRSSMTIAGPDEPGERIALAGRVFENDGVTPAGGVVMYVYHTDATGVYRKDGEVTGNGLRHGALRGWLVTDDTGRYEIRTIKPAPYSGRSEAAHIHVTLTPPGGEEDWVESFLFADDSLVSRRTRRQSEAAGRFGWVMDLTPNDEGVLVGERDIRLPD